MSGFLVAPVAHAEGGAKKLFRAAAAGAAVAVACMGAGCSNSSWDGPDDTAQAVNEQVDSAAAPASTVSNILNDVLLYNMIRSLYPSQTSGYTNAQVGASTSATRRRPMERLASSTASNSALQRSRPA